MLRLRSMVKVVGFTALVRGLGMARAEEGKWKKKKRRCRACEDDEGFIGDALAVVQERSGAKSKSESKERVECPPNSIELGRATWTYLHSLAAYYPDEPSKQQAEKMKNFIYTFSETYPCEYCSIHMQHRLKSHPPNTASRKEFSKWMCELHNEVNERLGKPQFDCAKVDERWLDGPTDGSCD